MNQILIKLRRIPIMFAIIVCAGAFANQALAQVKTGYYKSDDGGAYYIRQIGDKIYWFGEDPDGRYANVLMGTVSGNKITARWWDVPKGKTRGRGEIALEIREGGSAIAKLSSSAPFGTTSWHLAVPHMETMGGVSIPIDYPPGVKSRPAGFLGDEKDLTAAWEGNDYAVYYVRDTPEGEVVWVAEHRFFDYSQPAFTHVFFGKKAGTSISGQWVDVPKGKSAGSGTLTVTIKGPQDFQATARTGGFQASEWWRSLPNSLRGFADLHTHPMVNLGFGTKLVHGGTDIGSLLPADSDCHHNVRAQSIAQALGSDNPSHGGWGPDNNCGDDIREALVDELEKENHAFQGPEKASGYPSFKDWPRWNDITHQKMWVDWVRRAYDGGQRVMVALAVNNFTIASGIAGPGDGPTDDKGTADLQLAEIKSFVKRHADFMEVAYTPSDLRRIVASNKIAVVLGIEIDNIGNFIGMFPKTPVPDAVLSVELDRLYNEGVRYIFPIHLIDNKFGGTAAYQDIFNLSNYHVTGNFWDLECSSYEDEITYKFSAGGFDPALAGTKLLKGFNVDIFRNPPDSPVCSSKGTGHKNRLGLRADGAGERAIKQMMKRGMLIDIDHMSQAAANATLSIAEGVPNGYPLVSGHNNLRSLATKLPPNEKEARQPVAPTENSRTDEQLRRLGKLGGMFGLGSDGVDADDYLKRYIAASELIGRGRVSFGTDLNGLVKGPPPSNGANIYSNFFLMSRTADRTWDYRKDGVAHYGMLTDFLRDMSLKPQGAYIKGNIMHNAEYFAAMWEKAVANSKSVR